MISQVSNAHPSRGFATRFMLHTSVDSSLFPDWMLHDMAIVYGERLHEELAKKYVDGDINTQDFINSLEFLADILTRGITGTSTSRDKVLDDINKRIKKLQGTLSATF